jgi:hypothetical protein
LHPAKPSSKAPNRDRQVATHSAITKADSGTPSASAPSSQALCVGRSRPFPRCLASTRARAFQPTGLGGLHRGSGAHPHGRCGSRLPVAMIIAAAALARGWVRPAASAAGTVRPSGVAAPACQESASAGGCADHSRLPLLLTARRKRTCEQRWPKRPRAPVIRRACRPGAGRPRKSF